jgi:hypothetical protein
MKNIFPFLAILLLTFTSCKKEDETPDGCAGFTSLGTATVNGSDENLVVAQFLASGGMYTFQLASISSDCSAQKSINVTIDKPTGTIAGTYPISEFFDADQNEAYGSFITQKFNPISQTLEDLVSGTVVITEHATKEYTIDITAKTSVTPSVKFKARHKF